MIKQDYYMYAGEPIKIDFDCTDHMYFICPGCKTTMYIYEVETDKYFDSKLITKVTHFYVACDICRIKGIRKAYWRN